MFAALASLALSIMPLDGAPPEPRISADPALFAVRDADTTVYIFGTVHVLDPSIRWFDGVVASAFGQSDELVVETLPPRPMEKSSATPAPALHRATPAASFLVSSQAAVQAGSERGMTLESGADMVLLRNAEAAGKPVEPLETLQSQFAMLARLPGATAAPASPHTKRVRVLSTGEHDRLAKAMRELQSAWIAGDQAVFAAMLRDMRESSPQAYRAMFVERNVRWTDWIAARMREPGTVFVAVGAGHLAGPESLLVRLAQRGHVSRRVR